MTLTSAGDHNIGLTAIKVTDTRYIDHAVLTSQLAGNFLSNGRWAQSHYARPFTVSHPEIDLTTATGQETYPKHANDRRIEFRNHRKNYFDISEI